VLRAADEWVAKITPATENYERLLVEVIGVFEAHESPRPELLARLLAARDPRVRAYGTRVAGNWGTELPNSLELLGRLARDEHPRVRLEAAVAASYVPQADAVKAVTAVLESPRDPFLDYAIRASARALQPLWNPALTAGRLTVASEPQSAYLRELAKTGPRVPSPGENIYEMACLPCHQPEGKGLPGVYPALAASERLRGDIAPLIKIVLHGLTGPNTVGGQNFGGPNSVPMPSLGGLTDDQIAEVLTFVRREYGGNGGAVTPAQVRAVRSSTAQREGPWTAEELAR
jgi:mono/diheme cytochrome c family protein